MGATNGSHYVLKGERYADLIIHAQSLMKSRNHDKHIQFVREAPGARRWNAASLM